MDAQKHMFRLRVLGTRNLRVADTSVFPESPSGHSDAPARLAGELYPVRMPLRGFGTNGFQGEKVKNSLRSFFQLGAEETYTAVQRAVDELGTHLDLVLLHWPANFDKKAPLPRCAAAGWRSCRAQAWRGMERAQNEGKVRALGVSNFGVRHLTELLADGPSLPIAVNQVEMHPWWPQLRLQKFCREKHIQLIAYGSLGSSLLGGATLRSPAVVKVAKRVGRTPAQVLLRWAIQQGIAVIPSWISVRGSQTKQHHAACCEACDCRIASGVHKAARQCMGKCPMTSSLALVREILRPEMFSGFRQMRRIDVDLRTRVQRSSSTSTEYEIRPLLPNFQSSGTIMEVIRNSPVFDLDDNGQPIKLMIGEVFAGHLVDAGPTVQNAQGHKFILLDRGGAVPMINLKLADPQDAARFRAETLGQQEDDLASDYNAVAIQPGQLAEMFFSVPRVEVVIL
eukprot:g19540.t1